ncbi:hypothetical protein Peur_035307 [Populus x canadensis]
MAYGNGFCARKILRKSDNQSLNDLEVLFLDTGFGSSCAMSSILLFDTDLQSIEYIHSLRIEDFPRNAKAKH